MFSNPYYGVGLAVHSHLWCCSRCDFVGFLRVQQAPRDSEQVDDGRPAPRWWARWRIARLLWR
ncbi:hypothetical protein [Leifsonia sp. C5G2]|uniref:hypothetical protein n=1 Tax=Leifsonia sp. C5G2 TaxID=2735269 RepID=UPI001584AF59|nr:hypothetical protein [Leifsonia sp. C5G2]NUU07868.1 hypothetical protein [Leifsonia sp. C5G2]